MDFIRNHLNRTQTAQELTSWAVGHEWGRGIHGFRRGIDPQNGHVVKGNPLQILDAVFAAILVRPQNVPGAELNRYAIALRHEVMPMVLIPDQLRDQTNIGSIGERVPYTSRITSRYTLATNSNRRGDPCKNGAFSSSRKN